MTEELKNQIQQALHDDDLDLIRALVGGVGEAHTNDSGNHVPTPPPPPGVNPQV